MAESNRLERFCRPLPNRSDNAPCPMFIGLFAGAKVLFLFGMTKFFAYFFVFFFSRYLSVPLWRRLCWGHPVASDSQKMSLCIVFPSDGFRTNPTGNQQPTLSTMVICRVWVGMFRGTFPILGEFAMVVCRVWVGMFRGTFPIFGESAMVVCGVRVGRG